MKQKVALITGCSSGIGEDIALKLANENWLVFAGVRKQTDFDTLASKHANITSLFIDVSNPQHIEQCAALFEQRQLPLDVLINNAGIGSAGPIETTSMEEWQKVFSVNVFGLVNLTRNLLPLLRSSQGRVINIGSISGLVASPFMGVYAASKFAVEAISDALRRETKHLGIEVSVIEPGPINTKIWQKGLDESMAVMDALTGQQKDAYGEKIAVFKHSIEDVVAQALDVSATTQVIYHACSAPKPKTRYVVARKSAMVKLLRLLPDRLADKLILSMR